MANPDIETTSTTIAPEVTPSVASDTPTEDNTVTEGTATVTVNTDPVAAQVPGPAAQVQTTIPVHEVSVTTDRVITDTSSPLAVQVPETTGKEALTPIAKAYADGQTASEKIADQEAAEKKADQEAAEKKN